MPFPRRTLATLIAWLRPVPCSRRTADAALLAAMAASPILLYAAEPSLGDVVVTATRHEATVESLPATVTSLSREAMDRRQQRDEADLFRDEPDVAVARDLRRFGATRVNIRGIEDNRVVQMIDGVRLPDYYNGGGPTNFTMSATPGAMLDFLKRVEVVRGPASSLYGSDAIGGVVGFVTLNPADLLGPEAGAALRLKGGYQSAADAWTGTTLGALRHGGLELLLGYSRSEGNETENQGDVGGTGPTRSRPNPSSFTDQGLLAKAILRPAAGHKFTFTLEGREQQSDTDIRRLSASMPRVASMRGEDENDRLRGSAEWEHAAATQLYDRLTARVFHQASETVNHNFQRRTNTTNGCSAVTSGTRTCYIEQDFFFLQETSGLGLQLEKQLAAAGLTHLLTYGLDLSRTSVSEKRDGRIWNLTTGTFTKSLAGETYPLRDFAKGRTDAAGLFVQDEITGFFDGQLALTPGLRYDWNRLTPEVDNLAQQVLTALGRETVEKSHGGISPKLAAQWRFSPALSTYGQIAGGYRAPNYDEVNGAFRNASQFYSVVPNPDLKPETSVGLELGLRLTAEKLRGQFAVFDNRYRNFIEEIQLNCPADPRCYAPTSTWRTRISVNLSRVRIYGAELRGTWDLAPGWRADGALAWSHGTDEETRLPIDSVEPARLTLGLARDAGAWGAEGRLRAATRKDRVNESEGPWFRTPGYATVDLSAWVRLDRRARLTLAVDNLFDKKYWLWSDIRQADDANPLAPEFYTQPGRNFRIALQADF